MGVCLISSDLSVLNHWKNRLTDVVNRISESTDTLLESDEIVFILDRSIPENRDQRLFFEHHRVMVFSITPAFDEAQKWLNKGARGYGNAWMHEYHLHSAYLALNEGKVWLHPDFISSLLLQAKGTKEFDPHAIPNFDLLSKREQEVALMLGNGKTHHEISDALDITVRTIKAHATSIYQKLQVKDKIALSLLLHT